MGVFNSAGKISQYAKTYLDNRFELVKLELTEVVSGVFSKVLSLILLSVVGIGIYFTSMLLMLLLIAKYFDSYIIASGIILGIHIVLLVVVILINKTSLNNFFQNLLLKEFTDIEEDGKTSSLSAKEYKEVIFKENELTSEQMKTEFKSMFFIDTFEKKKAEKESPTYNHDEELIYQEMKNAFTDIISSQKKT